jgi:myosin-7
LGNVEIDDSDYEFGGSSTCKFVKNKYLDRVLALLGVDEKELIEGTCAISRKFMDGTTLTPRTKAGCENIRDALAKDLFNNCFSWIVRKLNLTLAPTKKARYTTIGLLDIFGFEDFTVNSIEQFCINYTNEKLQNLYISYVFKAEKVIFEEEGLSKYIGLISYDDNDVIIMMLDKPPGGIFHLIDSSCKMSKGNEEDDKNLVENIKKFHTKDKNFFSHRLNPLIFGIKHTAKDVQYTITGFVEKNKDELPGNLVECLNKGEKEIMKIFQKKISHDEVIEVKAKNPKDKYLGYKFRAEMQSLMEELISCECNFIRCIKPNADK